jgi:hypothetical protein
MISTEQEKQHSGTIMIQHITIEIAGVTDREHMALLLEVIAGDIRQGSTSGTDPDFSWTLV